MSQYAPETDAEELDRLVRDDPRLVGVPVKMRTDPFGKMLLLPIGTHVVVVPVEQVRQPSRPGVLDDVWRCLIVQSENLWEQRAHEWTEISRSELRRSVEMRAVVAPAP